jgi:glycosyltransferase involved in cell wall biosynthesis
MKIIQVCPRFFPDIGGIETHVYEISKRLARDNDVYVYTTDPTGKLPKQESKDGINIFRFKSFAPNEAYFFSPQLYFALRKQSCDVLHVHSFQALTSSIAYYAADKCKFKKIVYTPHYQPVASTKFRSLVRKFYDPIQARLFHKADKIICVSDCELGLINKTFRVPREKLIKIPNGIDVGKFENLPHLKNEGKKDKDKKDFQILFVGRLEKYKRVQWILFALKEILKKYPEKSIRFVIVGKGPYEKTLRETAYKFGLNDFVTFKSNLSDDELIEEYCRCDVFVMPSEYEVFSIVTLEALSCGKPVIVSDVGFLPEISKNNGYVIRSVEDLVKSLLLIIKNGMKVRFDFKEYSWDKIADKTFKVYVE